MNEVPSLTREQVEAAMHDTSHPIVQVMLSMPDYFQKFREGYEKVEGNEAVWSFITENFSPLIQRLNQLQGFSMGPLDMISIWSRKLADFGESNYCGYKLAGTLGAVYGTRQTDQKWRDNVEKIILGGKVPEDLAIDRQSYLQFAKRLKEMAKGIAEIDFYRHGTREPIPELVKASMNKHDTGARRRLDRLDSWSSEHDSPLLAGLHENFANGFFIYFVLMPEDIRVELD